MTHRRHGKRERRDEETKSRLHPLGFKRRWSDAKSRLNCRPKDENRQAATAQIGSSLGDGARAGEADEYSVAANQPRPLSPNESSPPGT